MYIIHGFHLKARTTTEGHFQAILILKSKKILKSQDKNLIMMTDSSTHILLVSNT